MNSIYRTLALLLCCTAGAMEKKYLEENGGFSNKQLIKMLAWDLHASRVMPDIDENEICYSLFRYYCAKGEEWREKLFDYLLEKGFDLTQEDSPIIDSIKAHQIKPIHEILKVTGFKLINRRSSKSGESSLNFLIAQLNHLPRKEDVQYYERPELEGNRSFYIEVLDILLAFGENPYLKNQHGKSAVDIANEESKTQGLSDYMEFKYGEFKRKRNEYLIDFTTRFFSHNHSRKLDESLEYGPFPPEVAENIAIYIVSALPAVSAKDRTSIPQVHQ